MEIKDFLHFYIGCDVVCKSEFPEFERTARLDGVVIDPPNDRHPVKTSVYHEGYKNRFHYQYKFNAVKPILRPLSSMTEEEERHMVSTQDDVKLDGYPEILLKADSGETFRWMLSKGFDLFGLIDAGLAIDRVTTLQK